MKKKDQFWIDCLTFLTFEQVIRYRKSRENFSLILVGDKGQKHEVIGSLVFFNKLSDNAFYFTFVFDFDDNKHYIKIKQNVKDSNSRYVDCSNYNPKYINYLRNLDTKSWQKEENLI